MQQVGNIMNEFCMKDIWRIHNPDKKEFSWRKNYKGPTKASRIDFALVTGGLDQNVQMTMYTNSIKTDHRAFYMAIDLNPFERGTGYWKFNSSLLQDKDFIEEMNQEIEKCQESMTQKEPNTQWELLKKRIKSTAIRFSRKKQSIDKLVLAQLSEKVDEYESRLPLNKQEDDLLEKTKAELEEKSMERIKGVMFRSKANWYEHGEKNSKYFFSLEKAKYNAKTCYKIIDEYEQIVSNPHEILNTQRQFYQHLYERDTNVSFSMQNNYNLYVPPEVKKEQETQITMDDLALALKGMQNGKTPGEDGIPADFYKVFWTKIRHNFYDMVLHNYQQGSLHPTARKGILNLILKPNKDSRYIKNLRPITLLNTDYKIIEKTIANKMIPALEHIIHKDQRGFMKDRRISVNIRKMLDIMHQTEKEDLEAVVLSLDFVKCFDKCSFSILHGSLEFFDFGQIVKEWTKLLYQDFTVKIQNNGHFSKEIQINKGVHQGGCCSSIYFLVIAEILALSLRHNQEIEGITFNDIRNLLNQFADDMDIFSINKEKSIRNIFQELESFKSQSGFTVSYEKTTLYRIGSLRHSDAQLYNMSEYVWSNRDITVLGVTIAHEDLIEKNYAPLMQKVSNTLNSWQNRGLSLKGKIQVVNTLTGTRGRVVSA